MGSTSPTLLQQFGPMIAATIALLGAMIALAVGGRREERRNRISREDDYRREQRQALADVLVAAQIYRREAEFLGRVESWVSSDYSRATDMKDRVDQAMGEVLNKLTVARLIVHGATMQDTLDNAFVGWQRTSVHIQPIVDAFFAGRHKEMVEEIAALDAAWPAFSDAMGALQSVALSELKPTIVPTD